MSAFRKRIRAALRDASLQEVLQENASRRLKVRQKAFETLQNADELLAKARSIRLDSIRDLDHHLARFQERLRENGVMVHLASNVPDAQKIVLDICTRHQAQLVAKAKSMVSEEILINAALENSGLRVVETDLGEYIVQLRGEPPSHIITPALHLKRDQVAETFRDRLGMAYSTAVADLNQAAHNSLRQVFIEADIGISGVNFGIAETGTICIVTNEGNGRMVTTLPRVHIALMGVERVIPRLQDLSVMLQLLPRSATGQLLSSYVSLIHGPRHPGEADGPVERHVVLIDHNRRSILEQPIEEALLCIRCGACLNACPVFQRLGGHPYQSPYPGPIGSVISPVIWGAAAYGNLAKASTLCGLCKEVCPVGIDLPGLLLEIRRETRQMLPSGQSGRWIAKSYSWVMRSNLRYTFARRLAALASRLLPGCKGWIRWAPPPLSRWTSSRDLPRFTRPGEPLKKFHAEILQPSRDRSQRSTPDPDNIAERRSSTEPASLWCERSSDAHTEILPCAMQDLPRQILEITRSLNNHSILATAELKESHPALCTALQASGIELILPSLLEDGINDERQSLLRGFDEIPIGLTHASAGLADTGSIVLSDRSRLPSLLPHTHIAILHVRDIYPDMAAWMVDRAVGFTDSTTIIVTGPSRTADIEMTLTIGVHGPARLIVCLVLEDK